MHPRLLNTRTYQYALSGQTLPLTFLTSLAVGLLQPRLIPLRSLPYPQVQHDLLRACWDSKGSHLPIQPLHLLSLSASRVAQPTKDLRGLTGTIPVTHTHINTRDVDIQDEEAEVEADA